MQVNCKVPPADDTLKIVHILFRHGFRNPLHTYPNDPHINFTWPNGLGALTIEGIQQLYELGTNMNKRYKKILSKRHFNSNMLLVRSSEHVRTIMSAEAFMAGFNPPKKTGMWNTKLKWTPAAIHILPKDHDILIQQVAPCPMFDIEKDKYMKSPEMLSKERKNVALYQLITEKSGQNVTNVNDLFWFYCILVSEEHHGLKLPDWTKGFYPEPIRTIAVEGAKFRTGTTLLQKLKVGPFLQEVINNIRAKQDKKLNPDRDIFIYSGHDLTIVNWLHAMQVYDNRTIPDYGATITIEGHVNNQKSDKFEVRMFYFNNFATKTPKELFMPNCGPPCMLQTFVELYKHLLPKRSREAECSA